MLTPSNTKIALSNKAHCVVYRTCGMFQLLVKTNFGSLCGLALCRHPENVVDFEFRSFEVWDWPLSAIWKWQGWSPRRRDYFVLDKIVCSSLPLLVVLQLRRRPHPKIALNCIPRSCDIVSVLATYIMSNFLWHALIQCSIQYVLCVCVCDDHYQCTKYAFTYSLCDDHYFCVAVIDILWHVHLWCVCVCV